MEKYELLPAQLLHEGTSKKEDFFEPTAVSLETVLRVHHDSYVERLLHLALTKS